MLPIYGIYLMAVAALARKALGLTGRPAVRKIVLFDPSVGPDRLHSIVEACGGRLKKALPLINGAACVFPGEEQAISLLARAGEVKWVEDDFMVSIVKERFVRPRPKPRQQSMPWGVKRILAPGCWDRTTGKGVRVAVLDTGIDMNHPDLKSNVRGGYDTINERPDPTDDNGHGTHVAGTIAALNNGFGVVGVAPEASIYAVKAFDSRGQGQVSDIVQGVEWCVQQKVNIINMSFGTRESSKALTLAMEKAAAAGIIMVAAAGNEGRQDSVLYPGRDPNVMAVAATTPDDRIASFSSSGREVAISAPGEDVPSTYKGSTYKTTSGTSMACPHVSGVAALILSAVPTLTRDEVRKAICGTAIRLSGFSAEQQGAGLVSAQAALRAALQLAR
ncbi:MAG: S8 family peptidase [Bacillota bacterium]